MGNLLTQENTAILVDGAFYCRRANSLFGRKEPAARANELMEYCARHLVHDGCQNRLYRIYYYDCPPMVGNLYHPLLKRTICMRKTYAYEYAVQLHEALSHKRKVALRMGELQEQESGFRLKPVATNKLCRGEISIADLTERDFEPNFVQKGVDMRIGIDITTLADRRQVDQIVLISGDSDFIPAAKHARREGVDFVLDPLGQKIKSELNKHVDGLRTFVNLGASPEVAVA